ncbi:MAG: cation transporter [Phycisphaeraceae bacterium]|nr:cation transporter [Phycisphaeraceae bacterium]
MPAPTTDPSSPSRFAALGLVLNLCLAAAKLLAGLIGNSFALVADAVESITDILGSVVIWSGLRYGSLPPDEDHPYGHGKAEALAALIVACIIFLAGLGIAVESVRAIIQPHDSPAWWTLIVLTVVVATKETMFRLGRRKSRAHASDALAVDAFHHRADAITSLAAFIGITLALIGPRIFGGDPLRWATADDWAALLASGIILYNALSLARIPLRELMDRQPDDAVEKARAIAAAVPGVLAIEKCRARTSGSRVYLEMHVQVDPAISITSAHAIGGTVRAAVRAQLSSVADVFIHTEPHHPAPADAVPHPPAT